MSMTNTRKAFVDGSRAVKIVESYSKRRIVNLSAVGSDLYYGGDRNVPTDTDSGGIVRAGVQAEIKTASEIWVKRAANTAGNCEFSEEFS